MEIRDFLLWVHILSGASPTVAVRVLRALADGAAPTLTTFLACVNTNMQHRLKQQFLSREWQDKLAVIAQAPHIVYTDDAYPERLRELAQPPLVLFYDGDVTLLKQPCLAIVGARQASAYSRRMIAVMMADIPSDNVIVSGLARGADGFGHRAALGTDHATIAVIASGTDVYYPKEHRALQNKIAQKGLVLSEYPPGTPPAQYRFVARNRIIAGVCHALIVTEARRRSGSLITAQMALESGRDVFALPNRLGEPLGEGTNELINAGATPVLLGGEWQGLRYFD